MSEVWNFSNNCTNFKTPSFIHISHEKSDFRHLSIIIPQISIPTLIILTQKICKSIVYTNIFPKH